MIRSSHLVILLVCAVAGAPAAEAVPALGIPVRLELFLDGARLVHDVAVPAGRSRIDLPADAGEVVQVDGADGWLLESRLDSAIPPPEPPLLRELVEESAALDRRGAVIAAEEDAAARIGAELALRLGQRAVIADDEVGAWQGALDGLLDLGAGVAQRRLDLSRDGRALRERAAGEALPGLSFATVLGLDGGQRIDGAHPAAAASRAWRLALEGNALTRTVVIERAAAGKVVIVTGREDLRWSPRARLVAAKGSAILIRQAAVRVPAGFSLPAVPARLVGGTRAQPLAAAPLAPRQVTAGSAPVAATRSVTATARGAGWAEGAALTTAREQSWQLPALALAASAGEAGEVMTELHNGPTELVTDEWVLTPDLAPVLVRRLSVRLDAQPLAAGVLELVVDGTVLGRRDLATIPARGLIHLAAGEDQRVFLAETTPWPEEAQRAGNRKREGSDFRVRNLSAEAVRFACYLTRPISAAKGVTVTIDPATTPEWKEPTPGILRWDFTLAPGAELVLRRGWLIEGEGRIRL